MALHTRKKRKTPGLPEVVAALLSAVTLVFATAWWRDVNEVEWEETEGRILTCEIQNIHYNAQDYRQKVTMMYEYSVGTESYMGSFAGLWPAVGNVNALTKDRFNELTDKTFGLTVFYEPDNPGSSRLHVAGADNELWLGCASIAALVFTILYCVKVYPAWRLR